MSNKALVLPSKGAALEFQTRQIPIPGTHQIVVKNYAIGICPLDTGMLGRGFMVKSYPCVLGSDVAGTIHSIGSDVTNVKPGDRVAGFACMVLTGEMDQGAYQEYVVLSDNAVTKLPQRIGFEQGAGLPMAVATSGEGIFVSMGMPWGPSFRKQEGILLITGGVSSVGCAAVQIAKILGFTIFVTASPKHLAYMKKLGATQVFDYKDPEMAEKITDAARDSGRSIRYCFAAISSGGNAQIAAKILSAFVTTGDGEKAKLCVTQPWPETEPEPEGIEVTMARASFAVHVHKEFGAWYFNQFLAEKLESGEFVPSPEIEIVEGGLEKGVLAGLERYRKGVSGTKIVVPLGI
jgi:NADPH:quinone reductase-like Zn-dependent oxidoreductase